MAKKLLLVDDEKFFLEGLKEGLDEHADAFRTDICFSVDEAVKKCRKIDYDLVVSDIRMPKKSGLDLFVQLRKQKYKGGFIAMTAYGTEEVLRKIKKLGGLDVIMKPFNLQWFTEKILDFFTEGEGVSGTISSIDITSLLQMINLEKKTTTVKIALKNNTGYLFFDKGEIVHAEFEDMKGEEAAQSLLNLNRGRFSLLQPRKVDKTIDTPFMVLLMNAMKTIDEGLKEVDESVLDIESVEEGIPGGAGKDPVPEGSAADSPEIESPKEEDDMNVKKLNEAIEVQKENMGPGLLATDIYGTGDGQSIAGFNSNPQACALFNQITIYMRDALDSAGFPSLGRYYIMDLVDGKMVIVIHLGEYQWGMLVDRTKIQLGLLLNVVMPKMIDSFEQAMTD